MQELITEVWGLRHKWHMEHCNRPPHIVKTDVCNLLELFARDLEDFHDAHKDELTVEGI